MKELEVNATKAHHESMHIMKTNAVYVNKTEIYGYLSVLGEHFDGNDMILPEAYNEVNEIADIILPLYKNYVAGSGSKTGSQTKCNRVDSRTSMNIM